MVAARRRRDGAVTAFAFTAVALSNVFGFYMLPVALSAHVALGTADAAITATATATCFLAGAATAPVVGVVLTRVAAGRVVLAGSFVVAGAMLTLGWATEPWHLFAGFMTLGVGGMGAGYLTYTTYVVQRFGDRAERPVGIVMTGLPVGGALVTPLFSIAVSTFGFPRAATVAAVLHVLVIGIPCAVVMRRGPDGVAEPARVASPAAIHRAGSPGPHEADRPLGRPMALTLLLIIGTVFTLGSSQVSMGTQLVSLAADQAPEATHLMMPLLAGSAMLCRFAVLTGLPRMGGRTLLLLSAATQAAGLAVIAVADQSFVLLAGVALFGFSIGNGPAALPLIVLESMGPARYSRMMSVVNAASAVSSALGTSVFGILIVSAGGFLVPTALAALASVVAFGLVWFIRPARTAPRIGARMP